MNFEVTNVKMTKGEWGKIRAFASITLNDAFIVNGIKVIEGQKGLFIGMPSVEKDGNYKDICFPTSKEARGIIEKAVLTKYNDNKKTETSTKNDDLFE